MPSALAVKEPQRCCGCPGKDFGLVESPGQSGQFSVWRSISRIRETLNPPLYISVPLVDPAGPAVRRHMYEG